jgi:AcrR family transcriptional regulator
VTGAVDGAIPGSRSATAPDRLLPRGRHTLPREFVAHTQRDRLMDAMAQMVATKGYTSTSLNDVCVRAGVSTKTFYQHFDSKESCFLATFDHGVELVQRTVASAYLEQGEWPDRIRRGLNTLLHILAAEPAFATLAVVESLAAGPRAVERRRTLLASYHPFFADAPGSPPLSPAVVEALVGGVYQVIYDHVASGRTAQLPERLPELTYFLLAPVMGRVVAKDTAGLP